MRGKINKVLPGKARKRRLAKKRRSRDWRRLDSVIASGSAGEIYAAYLAYGRTLHRHRANGLLAGPLDPARRPTAIVPAPAVTRTLVDAGVLSPTEAVRLSSRGINFSSVQGFASYCLVFPTIGKLIDLPAVTSELLKRFPAQFGAAKAAADEASSERRSDGFGAAKPSGGNGSNGGSGGRPPRRVATTGGRLGGPRIPNAARIMLDGAAPNWPPRQQGLRGTCVAFATVASLENLHPTVPGSALELSEQFLYWAMKMHPSHRCIGQDGACLADARDALERDGVCLRTLCPYSQDIVTGNISHDDVPAGSPDIGAKTDAQSRKLNAPQPRMSRRDEKGNAERLYRVLVRTKRPVVITLPVFAVPFQSAVNNWNASPDGRVLDVETTGTESNQTQIAVGGHAVAIIGYDPGDEAHLGGLFWFRNSWGTGTGSPHPNTPTAASRGYGQVSALYVERFLWELWAPMP